MRSIPGPDERTTEAILRGRIDALEGGDRALAETLARLRSQAVRPVQPSARLLQVFADGLDQDPSLAAPPAVAPPEVDEPAAAMPVGGVRVGVLRRVRGRARGRAAQVAGLSLAAKLVLAGTAAAAAAVGGAGAAGVLPGQAGTTPYAPPEGTEIDLGRPVGNEPAQDGSVGRGADGQDVADDARRGDDGGGERSGATPEPGRTGSDARLDRGFDRGEGTGRQPGEQAGDAGERGLSRAAARHERSAGSAARPNGGGAHPEARQREHPAPMRPASRPPAGPDAAPDHAEAGSASGPPPSHGRNDEDRRDRNGDGPDGPRRDDAGQPS